MTAKFDKLLEKLTSIRDAAESIRESILANLVMIGEVPAPTFHEEKRIELLLQRFSECGLQNCSIDEKMNGFGILPGKRGARNILIVANADTLDEHEKNTVIEIRADKVVGPFVGDNSLALAAMTSIPILLEKLDLQLKSNLIFMAASRSLGRGNMEGLRFFLSEGTMPVNFGLCVEGVQLGRLNYSCMGMLRGDIICRLPEDYDWSRFGSTGAIIPMNDVITRISKIPLPHRPMTNLILGSINGGISYQNIARHTTLCFEVRSESAAMLNQVEQQIEDITAEVTANSGIDITLDIFARRNPGGIKISHPLIRSTRDILNALNIQPMMYPTTSAVSAPLIYKKIPAVTLGFTTGKRRNELDEIEEVADIEPMSLGMTQLIGVLLSMDGGFADGE